jgi:hypothetical protein
MENEMKTYDCFKMKKNPFHKISAILIAAALILLSSCFQPLEFNTNNSGVTETQNPITLSWEGVSPDALFPLAGKQRSARAARATDDELSWGEDDALLYDDIRYAYYMTRYGIIHTDLNNLFATTTPNSRILPRLEAGDINGFTTYQDAYINNRPFAPGHKKTFNNIEYSDYGTYTDAWRKAKYLAAVTSVETYLNRWVLAYQTDYKLYTGRLLPSPVDLNYDILTNTTGSEYNAAQRYFNQGLSGTTLQTKIFARFAAPGTTPGKITLTLADAASSASCHPLADPATIDGIYGDDAISIPTSGGKVTAYYDGLAAVWLKPISANTWLEILPFDANGAP